MVQSSKLHALFLAGFRFIFCPTEGRAVWVAGSVLCFVYWDIFFFNFGLRYVCWVGLVRVLFTWAVIVLKQPSTHGWNCWKSQQVIEGRRGGLHGSRAALKPRICQWLLLVSCQSCSELSLRFESQPSQTCPFTPCSCDLSSALISLPRGQPGRGTIAWRF